MQSIKMLYVLTPTIECQAIIARRTRQILCLRKYLLATSANQHSQKPTDLPKDVGSPFPDAYDSSAVEEGWYNWWKERGYFSPSSNSMTSSGGKSTKTFSVLLPPPNVTGQLHLGHALTATVQDALVRWHRMKGYETVWVPGSDHAGIATQVVVEKWIQSEKGVSRHQLGRERFLQEIWKWRKEKGDQIFAQLERLGSSLDWNRKTFTMDELHSKAVAHAFVQLFDRKLIYRGNFLVNWSTRLRSAISDIEVDHVEVLKRTKLTIPGIEKPVEVGLIYDVAYKIYNENSPLSDISTLDEIVVSTTRPETLLGDVAVAVHPSDVRYSHLVSRKLIHPFRKGLNGLSLIPIVTDESVNPAFGTGAVKVTPGHDQTDFDIGKRHQLPIVDVIDEEGNIRFRVLEEGKNDYRIDTDYESLNTNGEKFQGLPRFTARWSILGELKSLGLFRGQKEHAMKIPVCSRSGDIIEPLLKPQWFLKTTQMNKRALEAAESGEIRFDPEVNKKLWGQWLSADRDWCISRQLWWGHRIPVWKLSWKTCKDEFRSKWISAVSQSHAHQIAKRITNSNDYKLVQDEDVLDTWFSSAILPFANFGWPNWTDDFDRYFPLSIMETGHDILFFWVARMVMLSQELTGILPFQNVLLHGIICDSQGRKMSKSLGNVIDPLSVIDGKPLPEMERDLLSNTSISSAEKKKTLEGLKKEFPDGIPRCGTDALRFGLCTYDIKGHYINLDIKMMRTSSAFCNKIWQAARFYVQMLERFHSNLDKTEEFGHFLNLPTEHELQNFIDDDSCRLHVIDKWILSQCSETVSSVNENLRNGNFHLISKNLRHFLYTSLCDVYLECIKARLSDVDSDDFLTPLRVLNICLHTGLKLAHPVMPFITEELFQRICAKQKSPHVSSIMLQKYPTNDEWQQLQNVRIKSQIELVLEIVVQLRSLKQFYDLKRYHKPGVLVLMPKNDEEFFSSDDLPQFCDVIQVLGPCGPVQIEFCEDFNISELQKLGWSSSKVTNRDCVILVNVSSHIDVTRERNRIDVKKEKVCKDLRKLEVALAKAKHSEAGSAAVEAKISAIGAELKYLEEQLQFLKSFQSSEK